MSESNHVQVNNGSVFTSRRFGPKELNQHGKQNKSRVNEKSSSVSKRRTESRGREQPASLQFVSASAKLSITSASSSVEVPLDFTSGADYLMSSSPVPVPSMSATQATTAQSAFAANTSSTTTTSNNNFSANASAVSSIVGRPYKANAKALKNKGRAKKKIVINSSGGGGGGGLLHDDDELDELDPRSYNTNSRSAARNTRPSKRPSTQRARSAYHPAPRKKEAFLQANYHFTITPGEYKESLSNPDKPVSWDAVECVHLPVTDNPPHCPICLDRPIAPKITKCGHIFCYACILHYLSIGPRSWKRCPLCFESVYPKALKSLSFDYHPKYKPGDVVDFVLLKRFKDSIVPFKYGDAPESDDNKFSRLTVTTDIASILNSERRELNEALAKQQQLAKEQEEALKKHMAKPPPAPSSFFGTAAAPVLVPPTVQSAPAHTPSPPAVNPGPVRRTLSDIVKEANGIGPAYASAPSGPAGTASSSSSGGYVAGSHHTLQLEDVSDTVTYIKAALEAIDQREKEWKAEQAALAAGPSVPSTHASKIGNPAPILDAFYESDDEPMPLVRSESTESAGRRGKKKDGDRSPTKTTANKLSASARAFVPAAAAAAPQAPLARAASHLEEKDGDVHYFYQAADGQQVYLHAVNYQCLITEYGGSPSTLPPVLSAQLMDVDSYVMDEDNRRKFRFLSHLPLTSSFHIFFVDLSPILSTATINQFADKLAQRLKRREAMAKEQERLSRLARESLERESLARSKSHPNYRLSENSDYASDDYESMHGTPHHRYAAPAPPDANESAHFPELKSDTGNKVSLSPPGSPTHTNAPPRVTGWSTLAQKGFASSTMWAALPAKSTSTPSHGPSQPGLSLSPKLQSFQSLSPEKTGSHVAMPAPAQESFSLSSSSSSAATHGPAPVTISAAPPSSQSAWGSVSSVQSPQTIIGNLMAATYGVSPHVSSSYVPPAALTASNDKSKKGAKKKKEVLFGVSSHHHYK